MIKCVQYKLSLVVGCFFFFFSFLFFFRCFFVCLFCFVLLCLFVCFLVVFFFALLCFALLCFTLLLVWFDAHCILLGRTAPNKQKKNNENNKTEITISLVFLRARL